MKLETVRDQIECNGIQSTKSFTIKASAQAFDILSSGLYSDKILAIVRELSCNAYDAHVLVNNQDVPFEIKLPHVLDQTFYIKDYGPGLSREDVETLYTTYFDSTKSNSNDFIGALGLGSKSPFSYVSTFTVESRFEGVKTQYICFKDDYGIPAISIVHSEPTDEPSGMTISLSSKYGDIYNWEHAAKKALMYFPCQPIVIGKADFAPFAVSHTMRGTNWKCRVTAQSAYMYGPYVIQGCVAYPIDSSIILEQPNISSLIRVILGMPIDFTVSLGDVDVAASRESLSYTPRTTANLVKLMELAVSELRQSIQQGFDDCKTRWDMFLMYDSIMNDNTSFKTIFESFNKDDPFMWNGAPVTDTLTLTLSHYNISNFVIKSYSVGTRSLWSISTGDSQSLSTLFTGTVTKNLHIVTSKTATNKNNTIRNHIKTLPLHSYQNGSSSGKHVWVIKPHNKKVFNQEELDRLIKAIGCPNVIDIDELHIPAPSKKSYVRRAKTDKYKWTGFVHKPTSRGRSRLHRHFGRACWTTETIDITEGGLYVPIDYYSIVDSTIKPIDFHDIYKLAITLGVLPPNTSIYGIHTKDVPNLNDKWINAITYIRNEYKKLKKSKVFDDLFDMNEIFSGIHKQSINEIVANWKTYSDKMTEGSMKQFLERLHHIRLQHQKYTQSDVQLFEQCIKVPITTWQKTQTLITEWKTLNTKIYPMLYFIDYYEKSRNNISTIIEYINLVEEYNQLKNNC